MATPLGQTDRKSNVFPGNSETFAKTGAHKKNWGDFMGDASVTKGGVRHKWPIRSAFFLWISMVVSACSLLGGGDSTPQKEQARLEIAIHAARDLNQDARGRAAPMLLRVYELKSDIAFQEADFFALQNTDKAVLGADLLAVDQYVMRPDENREIRRKTHPETTVIAVFAGYRDLPNATWRVVHKMPPAPAAGWYRAVIPSIKARLKIELQANAILLTDEENGARAVQYANESIKGLEQPSPPADVGARTPSAAISNSTGTNGSGSVRSGLSGLPDKSTLDVLPKTPLDVLKKIGTSP